MKIGIVGARLAGSYAGLLLARMGHQVLLLDPSTEEEKPCGGGVTAKAWASMSWLQDHPLPHTIISSIRLCSAEGESCELSLRHPIFIFSRSTLDGALREDAVRAGADFLRERALSFSRTRPGWAIQTARNDHQVDFLVGADGARSTVRAVLSAGYGLSDLSLALGFYLPGAFHRETVVAAFQERGFKGYLWSFPRVDHSSVGILRWLPEANAADLKRRVTAFIAQHYPEVTAERRFYAARIPCLGRRRLLNQRVAGPDWALLGDAAGFADAITGEGIYYALRSAELLTRAIERGNPSAYEEYWRDDFGRDLLRAASWHDRFYGGRLLWKAFTSRAMRFAKDSGTVRELVDSTIAGRRSYQEFFRTLVLKSPLVLLETLRNHFHRLAVTSRPFDRSS
jgi:flavin-dependent dehydrogenase